MSLRTRFVNFLYNLDRAVASLFGAPAQETISSEIGRHASTDPVAKIADKVLDDIQANHSENAVKHADALEKVDDGFVG